MNPEIASAVKNTNMIELAEKTIYMPNQMTSDEAELTAELDKHFKTVGETGYDDKHEIASFIRKALNEDVYNYPSEILDSMFDRGTIGEFDDYEMTKTAKNKLIAYESAKGGNVDRSWLDITSIAPTWKHLQVESDLSYTDLRRNGWKTVALLTDYAKSTLENKMFKVIFDKIDSLIVSGNDNYIAEATAAPTAASADAAALYINDRANGNGIFVSLTKYVQAMSKLSGFASDDMKNIVNRTGKLGYYDGVSLVGISSARKLGNGELPILTKRVFGIAGKIGTLNMRGDIRVYETNDNNSEKTELKITGFEFGYAFNTTTLENMCKIVMAQ